MKDYENMKKAIKLYKFTLVVLATVIIIMMMLFSGILLYIVPKVVARSVSATSDARRTSLLEQIHDTTEDAVVDALSQYDITPN